MDIQAFWDMASLGRALMGCFLVFMRRFRIKRILDQEWIKRYFAFPRYGLHPHVFVLPVKVIFHLYQ